MSSSVILFNKYILDEKKLAFRTSLTNRMARQQLTNAQASPFS